MLVVIPVVAVVAATGVAARLADSPVKVPVMAAVDAVLTASWILVDIDTVAVVVAAQVAVSGMPVFRVAMTVLALSNALVAS